MKKTIPALMLLTILITSCKKEVFPEMEDLTGTWIEQTDNSFKHKLIFDGEVLYFVKPTSTDTLLFQLDKEKELIYLSLINDSASGESSHEIILNNKENTLSIRGLFVSIPENISETVFKKE